MSSSSPSEARAKASAVNKNKKSDENNNNIDESCLAVDDLTTQVGQLNVNDKKSSSSSSTNTIPDSIQKVADWILKKGMQKSIIVLTGAGVSVSAGIPDFRTPGTGLYDNLQTYNLPYPEAVFDVSFYRTNPQPFCTLAKEIWPGFTHSPTLTHSFLTLLSKKGLLLRNYSQNIDGLEFLAGMPADDLVECHGHFRTASCIDCGAKADGEVVKNMIAIQGKVPKCKQCGGYVKPDIVFFGESLPDRFHRLLRGDVKKAKLMLIIGTSLQVAPVSLIPSMVNCPRVLVNREQVLDDLNEQKSNNNNSGGGDGGDVFVKGDCDDSIILLARALGWEEELLELNQQTKIDNKDKKETSVEKEN